MTDFGPNTETAGGSRYSAGKPKMTWAPWLGMMEVCRVSTYGAEKYAPLDWQNGQSFSTLLSSGMRHLMAAMSDPTSRDAESKLLHVGHAAWNILTLLHFLEQGRETLDDVTPWRGVTSATRPDRQPADPAPEWSPYDGEGLVWPETEGD